MQRSHAFAALIAAFVGFAAPARATDAAPTSAELVASGRSFALKVCWACHIVAADQIQKPILTHPGPSFLVIAQRSDLSDATLRGFLSSHSEMLGGKPGMPNPRLADYQIDEVVAYIESLKK